MRVAPSRSVLKWTALIGVLSLVALILGTPLRYVAWIVGILVAGLAVGTLLDYWLFRKLWRAANVRFTRRLPAAFAIGVARDVRVILEHGGDRGWHFELYDHVDSSVTTVGLPQTLELPKGKGVEATYRVTPARRGEITFAPAELRCAPLTACATSACAWALPKHGACIRTSPRLRATRGWPATGGCKRSA